LYFGGGRLHAPGEGVGDVEGLEGGSGRGQEGRAPGGGASEERKACVFGRRQPDVVIHKQT
jgi:hypothetical protein